MSNNDSNDDDHSQNNNADQDEDNTEVYDPNDRDVLCGRGGMTNTHQGNAWYRSLVRANRPLYRASPKHSKILVAKRIVHHVLSQNPPCRFLERRKKDGPWFPVPYKRAVDKTSQALREKERLNLEGGGGDLQPPMTAQEAAKVPLYNDVYAHRAAEARLSGQQQQQHPDLILPPQPDYSKTVVRKSVDKNFSIHEPQTSFAAFVAQTAEPEVTIRTTPLNQVPIILKRHAPAAAAAMPNQTLEQKRAQWKKQKLNKTASMESNVNQISSRFWDKNAAAAAAAAANNTRTSSRPSTSRYRRPLPTSKVRAAATVRGAADALATLSHIAAAAAEDTLPPTVAVNQFLHGGRRGSSAPATDQFADSQDDLFADAEEEESLTSSTMHVKNHQQQEPPVVVERPLVQRSLVGRPVVPFVPRPLVEEEQQQPKASPINGTSSSTTCRDQAYLEAPEELSARSQACVPVDRRASSGTSSAMENHHNKSSSPSSFVGALCRVCKETRFHPFSVPESHYAETHPQLVWPMEKAKSRRAITAVLEHCLAAHPHWPLWNTLSNISQQKDSSSFPANAKPANVMHRALVAAASSLPHKLGDTYASLTEMNYRIFKRIGLAEGYLKWGAPWDENDAANSGNNKSELQEAAYAMVRDYGYILVEAVSKNWRKIEHELSHQERLDLFNNVFVVPYCVDNLRENGELFPPVYPSRTTSDDGDTVEAEGAATN